MSTIYKSVSIPTQTTSQSQTSSVTSNETLSLFQNTTPNEATNQTSESQNQASTAIYEILKQICSLPNEIKFNLLNGTLNGIRGDTLILANLRGLATQESNNDIIQALDSYGSCLIDTLRDKVLGISESSHMSPDLFEAIIKNNRTDLITELTNKNIYLEQLALVDNKGGESFFVHKAIQLGCSEAMIEKLIQNIPETDRTRILNKKCELPYNYTPLHYAAMYNHNPDIFQALLQHGANPEIQNANGDTPLHKLICSYPLRTPLSDQDEEIADNIVRLLIENNDNLYIENRQQQFPLLMAVESENPKLVKIFAKYTDVNHQNTQGKYALYIAAEKVSVFTTEENSAIADLLKDSGADALLTTKDGDVANVMLGKRTYPHHSYSSESSQNL